MRFRLVFLLAVACQKVGPAPAPSVPEPADLIAVVSVASPKAALARVRAYVDLVQPGIGANLKDELIPSALAEIVGAPALDGVDLDQPASLLILDPRKHGRPVALLATVSDAGKLKGPKVTVEGKHAVVGPAEVVDAVSAYALAVVAARAAPSAVTATCAPGKLLGLYRADLENARKNLGAALAGQAVGKILEAEIDLLIKLAEQTDDLRATVDAGADDASFELTVVPRAGTTFAAWQAAQRPMGDLSLLERLPAVDAPTFVMAGNLQLGPLRDLALDLLGPIFEQMLGKKIDRAAWNAFIDGFDGTIAALAWSGAGGAMGFNELAGYADGARAVAQARDLFGLAPGPPKTGDIMGLRWSYHATGESKHGDALVLGYEMTPDYATFPEAQREIMRKAYGDALRIQFAGFDKLIAVSMGPDAPDRIGAVIDAARKGGGTIPPAARAALDAARARKASVAFFMDYVRSMAALLPGAPPSKSGALFEMAVRDGATRFRFGVPAAHVREVMAAFLPK